MTEIVKKPNIFKAIGLGLSAYIVRAGIISAFDDI
jgi:hypothetical protein